MEWTVVPALTKGNAGSDSVTLSTEDTDSLKMCMCRKEVKRQPMDRPVTSRAPVPLPPRRCCYCCHPPVPPLASAGPSGDLSYCCQDAGGSSALLHLHLHLAVLRPGVVAVAHPAAAHECLSRAMYAARHAISQGTSG